MKDTDMLILAAAGIGAYMLMNKAEATISNAPSDFIAGAADTVTHAATNALQSAETWFGQTTFNDPLISSILGNYGPVQPQNITDVKQTLSSSYTSPNIWDPFAAYKGSNPYTPTIGIPAVKLPSGGYAF